LQTTYRGAPVAAWTVAKELGHTGTSEKCDVVEYRVEPHAAKLGDRLVAVTSGNRTGSKEAAWVSKLL